MRSVGTYFFSFGNNPTKYNAKTTPPVPHSTAPLESRNTENKTNNVIVHNPKIHQHTTENIRLSAMELSQKYELYK